MQSAGDLIRIRIEFAAGVQHRHHDFRRRSLFLLVNVGRDTAAVIDDRNRIVHVDRYLDRIAVACEGLVNRIINNFVNQVMQTDVARRADIHRRTLADGVASFKNGYRICTVFCLFCFSQFIYNL